MRYNIELKINYQIDVYEFDVMLRTNTSLDESEAFYSVMKVSLKEFDSLGLTISGDLVVKIQTNHTYQVLGIDNDSLTYVFVSSLDYTITNQSRLTFKTLGEIEIIVDVFTKTNGVVNPNKVGSISLIVNVVNPYQVLSFVENTANLGLGGIFALANKNSLYQQDLYRLSESVKSGQNLVNYYKIEFSIDNNDIATIEYINTVPYLKILDNGFINLVVKDKDSILLDNIVSSSLTIQCVLGINVYNENDLDLASKNKEQIVLRRSISIGQQYLNANKDALKPNVDLSLIYETHKINETYDHTFYRNINSPYSIYYILEINNNLYGNGFKIDTHTISYLALNTSSVENISKCIFKGPLDLVRLGELAAVKAQDNISFLVRTNNEKLIIDNVELVSYDSALSSSSSFDLNSLNNVGTTLEIMSDNVYVTNSRIGFGRNTIRAYGLYQEHSKITPNHENNDINVYFYGDIISYSREFLLKIGTNDYVLATPAPSDYTNEELYQSAAPNLTNSDNSSYLNYNNPTDLSNLNDEYFVSKYLKTKITLGNSAFIKSGLFSIGVETHFSGPVLNSHKIGIYVAQMENWRDVSGTSYACLLKLEDDVYLYDWKSINYVDSSTLIELLSSSDDTLKDYLSFDIKQILLDINKYLENPLHQKKDGIEGFSNSLIYDSSISQYFAHGGIVFYGGGKNYSMFDNQTTNLREGELSHLKIKLEDISSMGVTGGTLYNNLKLAAGEQAFNFFMLNKDSTITPQTQSSILANNRVSIKKYDITQLFN
jgi:hypothetical protein